MIEGGKKKTLGNNESWREGGKTSNWLEHRLGGTDFRGLQS